jgi:DNA replication protein DnaC
LLEIIDDRHGSRSTIVASQLPIDKWHARIGDPTIADAILDRLFHNVRNPTQAEHLFRAKPNTDSDASRTPVPSEAEH